MEDVLSFIAGFAFAIAVSSVSLYIIYRVWWYKTKQGRWVP